MREGDWVPPPTKTLLISLLQEKSLPNQISIPLPSKVHPPTTELQFSCYNLIKTSILVVFIASVYTSFILTSYSLYTQEMIVLVLIDIQYLQNVAFNFEKSSNSQNHSSDSHQLIKKFPPSLAKFYIMPPPH